MTVRKLVKVYPVPAAVKLREVIPPVALTERTTAAALELPKKSVSVTASLTTYAVPGTEIRVIAAIPKSEAAVAPEPPPPVITTVGGDVYPVPPSVMRIAEIAD